MWEFNMREEAGDRIVIESYNSFIGAWMMRISDQYPAFLGRFWLHKNTTRFISERIYRT